MKIKMTEKIINTGLVISEEYDIENDKNPEEFASNSIKFFNNTLRPNESPRELISVEVIEEHSTVLHDHIWEKQNAFTITNKRNCYDILKCKRCGVTAKRYGIGNNIGRDGIYKAKCYAKCETALAQMEKNRLAKLNRSE